MTCIIEFFTCFLCLKPDPYEIPVIIQKRSENTNKIADFNYKDHQNYYQNNFYISNTNNLNYIDNSTLINHSMRSQINEKNTAIIWVGMHTKGKELILII